FPLRSYWHKDRFGNRSMRANRASLSRVTIVFLFASLGAVGAGGCKRTAIDNGGISGNREDVCARGFAPSVSKLNAFPRLHPFILPSGLVQAPGDDSHFYVLERAGVIKVFENRPDVEEATVFMDLSDRVNFRPQNSEAGLNGLVFHPDFANNHIIFVTY